MIPSVLALRRRRKKVSHGSSVKAGGTLGGSFVSDLLRLSTPLGQAETVGRVVIGNRNMDFLENWATGNLPSRVNYGPTAPESIDMQQSPAADLMRAKFYGSGYRSIDSFRYDTGRAYVDTVLNPDYAHSTALQVGGFDGATAVNNGNGTATFTITNVAGANSFFYHLPFVQNNPFGPWGPMHNVTQTFSWTEPIDGGP